MIDPIEREDAIRVIEALECFGYIECKTKALVNDINAIPSADRPQGKWILSDVQHEEDTANGNYAYICSNCHHTDVHAKTMIVPFCWYCGAEMEGADE